jgi:hypothetical protein
MVIHLGLVVLGPSFERLAVRKHGITRLTELRVDRGKSCCCTLSLRSTETRRGSFLSLRRPYYSPDIVETLCFTSSSPQVVSRSAVEEGEVGNEQRVLDVGQGCKRSNLRI